MMPGIWNTETQPNFSKLLQEIRLNRIIAEKLFLFAFDCKMPQLIIESHKE